LARDPFLVLADYEAYIRCQNEVSAAFRDETRWTRMSILNVARSGRFSSDRAIREYQEKSGTREKMNLAINCQASSFSRWQTGTPAIANAL
jgi:starch phosphorylase